MTTARASVVLGVLLLAGGCAYYNALWRANRMADEAERAGREGLRGEARFLWEQAALKAESVAIKHPNSKWTDDALRLEGRALAELGRCEDALEPLERAYVLARGDAVAEARTAVFLSRCAVLTGDGWRGHEVATRVFELDRRFPFRDRSLVSEARLWRGAAAMLRGDSEGALADYRLSDEPAARVAAVFALAEFGSRAKAIALIDSLLASPIADTTFVSLFAELGTLDRGRTTRVLAGLATESSGQRWGPLVLQTADAALAEADTAWATELYRRAFDGPLDDAEQDHVRLALSELALRTAGTKAELAARAGRLRAIVGERSEVQRRAGSLSAVVDQIIDADSDAEVFLAAEAARDDLGAADLAATLFAQVSDVWPESPFAPKASLALASLRPALSDSLKAYVRARYPNSPYVLALRGIESVAFRFFEDSLLKVSRSRASSGGWAGGPPVPPIRIGPRWVPPPPPDSGGGR